MGDRPPLGTAFSFPLTDHEVRSLAYAGYLAGDPSPDAYLRPLVRAIVDRAVALADSHRATPSARAARSTDAEGTFGLLDAAGEWDLVGLIRDLRAQRRTAEARTVESAARAASNERAATLNAAVLRAMATEDPALIAQLRAAGAWPETVREATR